MGEADVVGGVEPGGTGPRGEAAVQEKPSAPRTPRATRTREAVVDGLLALLHEGNLRPTAREVAARAGVSLRSVYVHFDDVEALFLAAAVRYRERIEQVRGELTTTGSLEERLRAFVDRKARSFETSPNVRRAGYLQEPFSPSIREVMALLRRFVRRELEEAFASELAEAGSERGRFQREAIVVASGPAAWDDMRVRDHLSVEEAKEVMYGLLHRVLRE